MKPIGLTYKPDGELMVVHQCFRCGKISCNRIAGDDNPYALTCLLEQSDNNRQGIRLLNQDDKKNVLTILYGYNYLKYLNMISTNSEEIRRTCSPGEDSNPLPSLNNQNWSIILPWRKIN